MPLLTLTFPPKVGVNFGTKRAYKPDVLTADFGNSYSLRVVDGINANKVRLTFTIQPLTRAEANTINNFLVARGGHEAFLYTLPGEVTAKQWLCKEWDYTYLDKMIDGISGTFEQNFDPA